MRKTPLMYLLILAAVGAFIALGGCHYHSARVNHHDGFRHRAPQHWSHNHNDHQSHQGGYDRGHNWRGDRDRRGSRHWAD